MSLLELAIDKGVEKFVRGAQKAGLSRLRRRRCQPTSSRFQEQAEDLQ